MYARINTATRVIESQIDLPVYGPPTETPSPEQGIEYRPLAAPIDWRARPTETSVLHWFADEDAPRWVEMATPAQGMASTIAAIDAAADAARLSAIGDPARALEYQRAEMQARAYAAAGYSGPMPRCVKAWADPKSWTGQQAADDIIATADVWLGALDAIREQRLAAKEAARAIAADPEGSAGAIYAVKDTFLLTLKTLMASIA